jgi:hypothetical protein
MLLVHLPTLIVLSSLLYDVFSFISYIRSNALYYTT